MFLFCATIKNKNENERSSAESFFTNLKIAAATLNAPVSLVDAGNVARRRHLQRVVILHRAQADDPEALGALRGGTGHCRLTAPEKKAHEE